MGSDVSPLRAIGSAGRGDRCRGSAARYDHSHLDENSLARAEKLRIWDLRNEIPQILSSSHPQLSLGVMSTAEKPKAGLEDTVATSSAICYLDGDRGVLAYCGYDIHDLARHATFEEVCFLLWPRRLPTRAELGDLQSQLVAARTLPEGVQRAMRALPAGNGMDQLRTLTSELSHYDPDANDNSPQ